MKILDIAIYELKMTIRNKLAFSLVIILPILMIALMGYALKPVFSLEEKINTFSIYYSNNDSGTIGKSLDSYLKKQDFLELIPINQNNLEQRLKENDSLVVVVDENLSTKVMNGEKVTIKILSSGKDYINEQILSSVLQSFINNLNTQLAIVQSYDTLTTTRSTEYINTLSEANEKFNQDFVVTTTINSANQMNISSFQFFGASMLIFFLLTNSIGIGLNIINERNNKIFMRITSFPIKKSEYLLGKILGNLTVAIIQSVSIILFTKYIFKVDWGNNFLGIGFIILLLFFISSALSILLSSIVSSGKAITASFVVMVWFMTFISGGFTAAPILEPFSKFTINSIAFDAITSLMKGGKIIDIFLQLFTLFFIGILIWTIGLTLYNRRVSHE